MLFYGIVRLSFRFKAVGQQHVPRRGGVLIAANHASYLDIPFVACGVRRRLAYMGRQDLFAVPGLNWACRWLGWIPIRQGRVDRVGFGKAIQLIQSGRGVVIFPEGRRTTSGQLQPGMPGLGVIVEETRCPVIPAFIEGSFEVLPPGAWRIRFRPVRVRFGKPLHFSPEALGVSGKEFYHVVSRTVMKEIAALGGVEPPAETVARVVRSRSKSGPSGVQS
jgi:1-acyl-sn-glycerol-3-phosphate acyltransferase